MAVVSSHPTHEARGVDIKISMPVAALPRPVSGGSSWQLLKVDQTIDRCHPHQTHQTQDNADMRCQAGLGVSSQPHHDDML